MQTDFTGEVYRAALEAIRDRKPFAAEGVPGTGKTETIKDLAKRLGRHLFVVPCAQVDAEVALRHF